MPEKSKSKKIRIYKFASEYNLATESLVEFLQSKGHKVKSHMSLLTDEMISEIQDHFKKDIENAEKHYRKISEFQKKRTEKQEEEQTEDEEVDKEETAEAKEEIVETEEEIEKVQASDKAGKEEETEDFEAVVDEIAEETDGVESEDAETFKTDSEKELVSKKKGLKILGKVDLSKKKKKAADKPKPKTKPKTKVEEKEIDVPLDLEPKIISDPETESDDKIGKKKKKKILKAKKKAKIDNGSEELTVRGKKRKKTKRLEIDKKDVDAAIKRTLTSMEESSVADRAKFRKKKKKEIAEQQEKFIEEQEKEKSKLKVAEYIAVNEIANLMNVPVSDVISKCIELGLMVSINQRLDTETITLVADEFGFEVEFQEEYAADVLEDSPDAEDTLLPRPPVVTIMGHVDHGKTSLLDYIRKANVVSGESGGITQHIGAYRVKGGDGKYVAFLDTPGHEAFTAMRARGAKVTDIVVLIVAADDAVMPQTVEAINHAQAANVPIVIAINKIDKPNANVEKIRQQLADRNILVEDWGGKYQCSEISAKTGVGVDQLLEKILLESDMLELKANPNRQARGAVVEAQLEQGRGVVATVLVQKGTLKVGDPFVSGVYHGRVRAMFDERNKKVSEAPPSTPVQVLGFDGVPQAGDTFIIVDSEREARDIALKRQQLKREQDHRQVRLITLDEIANQISIGGLKELPIIVKGDVDGSVEALSDSLMKLTNQEVSVKVIHKGVGAISEGDVLLAAASGAIIVGFHVRPNTNARKLAESEKVDIRLYNVIYDAINEVKSALEGLLSPVISEEMVATVEIRDLFKVPKLGTVAGCYVQDGKITRANKIRLFRDGIVIYEGELASLKRFKDDVKEVDAGYECGLNIHNFNDLKIGDIIESYKIVETKKTLE
ncbi:translation initiation factor IF-2 [Bacteroidota bacterium]